MAEMRHLTATTLFAVLMLPLFLPLAAFRAINSESQVPECCRRDGKHHCGMMGAVEQQLPTHVLRQGLIACPYCPARSTASPTLALCPPAAAAIYASIV